MPTISHLFYKPSKGLPMCANNDLHLIQGCGIRNDINANIISPRQVLVTRKEDLDELSIPYGGLRENIIVEGIESKVFIPGCLLSIGANIKIRMTFYCEPCKRINNVVSNLKEVVKRRGLLGVVIAGGDIYVGDSVKSLPNVYSPLPEEPYERFLNFIQHIPLGKVVTYKMITVGMGVAESYIRAIPKYIYKCTRESNIYPLHRIVDTNGALIDSYVDHQMRKLQEEHVQITSSLDLFETQNLRVPLNNFLWAGEALNTY
jgi:alkylated DNA nucleotide flippase Atl1